MRCPLVFRRVESTGLSVWYSLSAQICTASLQVSEQAGNVAVVSASGCVDVAVSPTLGFQCVASARNVDIQATSFEAEPSVSTAQQGELRSAVIASQAEDASGEASRYRTDATLALCSLRGAVRIRCMSWRSSVEQRLHALRGGDAKQA